MWGVGGLRCSYPTGVEKGISEPSYCVFNPPYYPATNYHSRGGDERKREAEGREEEEAEEEEEEEEAASPQYAFYKI